MPFPRKDCAFTARSSCQGSPLRSDEREPHAPLTARAARRPGPLGRAFVFYAPLRVASKAKIKTLQKEFSCSKPDNNRCFHSANSLPHLARWPLSKRQGKDRWTSSRVTFTAIGATSAKKIAGKTNSAWNGDSGS